MRVTKMAVTVLMLAACGSKRKAVDRPTPPDMAPVVQTFEAPDGVFDKTRSKAILDGYAAEAARVTELGLHQNIMISVRVALDHALAESSETQSSGELGVSRQQLSLEANGTIGIKRICNGWAAQPTPDPDNGFLTAHVNFSERGLDPVVWADAENCRYLTTGDSRVLVDDGSGRKGDVRMWLGRSATFESFGQDPVIFDLDLSAEVEGVAATAAFSFRLDPTKSSIAVSVAAKPGNVVVSSNATSLFEVFAANGTFECDLTAQTCTSDAGSSFNF